MPAMLTPQRVGTVLLGVPLWSSIYQVGESRPYQSQSLWFESFRVYTTVVPVPLGTFSCVTFLKRKARKHELANSMKIGYNSIPL